MVKSLSLIVTPLMGFLRSRIEMNNLKEKAQRAIDHRDSVCFAICAECSQIFDNVKHMRWFLKAVMRELDEN